MRRCKLLILQKLQQNNVLKNVEKCYPKCNLMEDTFHSLIARSLPENSFIDFRIKAHSFQTDFIFEIISYSLQKGVFSRSSYTFVLSINPKDCCLVILEATDLF